MFIHRVLSALVLIPLTLLVVWKGGGAYFLLVSLVTLLASYEYYNVVARRGCRPSYVLGMGLTILFLLDAWYVDGEVAKPLLAGALISSLIWQLFRRSQEELLTSWALTLTGALYVGWLGAHFLLLRGTERGLEWTGLALLSTWACDSGAYLFGSTVGHHGFFTKFSPHKTWEGAIGGWSTGLLATLLLGHLIELPFMHSLALGIAIVLAATFGDLAESMLKRQAGVKDSGKIIPGHGGMLDRVDSLLFVVVVVYYYATRVLGTI